jgi:hypothetical protein
VITGPNPELLLPLPVEVVRCILELATEDKRASLALALVSKAVQSWITPIIYHTVILTSEGDIKYFYHTLQESKANLGASVRFLLIKHDIGDTEMIAKIVCGCVHVECIFTDAALTDPKHLDTIDALSFPAPWHMMMTNPQRAFEAPLLGHPLLRNITHLYVDLIGSIKPFLSQLLPCLTHLGFGCWATELYVPRITYLLSSLPLVVLLLHAYEGFGKPADVLFGLRWHELAQIEDERLFAGPGLCEDDYIELLRSGGTIWDGAQIRYKDWRRLVKTSEG